MKRKVKSNSVMGRIPPELSSRAKSEGLSTTAYTKKLLSEYDLLKEMVKSSKNKGKGGFFGGLQI